MFLNLSVFGLFFFIIKKLNRLRVGEIFEILGQDILDKYEIDLRLQKAKWEKNKLNDMNSIMSLEKKQRKYFTNENVKNKNN